MIDNQTILHDLFTHNAIRIHRGKIFDRELQPKTSNFDFAKVEGMMLGLAVGDALGNTTEGLSPAIRADSFGEVREYLMNRRFDAARGFPSDDTQLAYWTLEQIIQDRGFDPQHVAEQFCNRHIYGVGLAVSEFRENFNSGKLWFESGPESAGNGALMRIAPILIPHLKTGRTALWTDTALCAMITHNDTASISACLAFVAMLWDLLAMKSPPPKDWWLHRYLEVASDLEIGTEYKPRAPDFIGYSGSMWKFVEQSVGWADFQGLSTLDACTSWHSGAYLFETVPSVLYILKQHAHDPEAAIIRAVNDTHDNDTIAAIVGAAVGALHGKDALPKRWIENHTGRTRESDDGRIFELLEQAKQIFWDKR
ncbi:ADP-ribosylglycohydrolase family protein [bacterium]|nr:ADP-ribosylglycohydrolase family protein [bacterium]